MGMKWQSICLILGLLWNSYHVKSTGEGDVRLTGGDGFLTGTVEINHNDLWGTVCDDGWDIQEAYVVCRQLGLGPAVRSRDGAYFGMGSGPISLDEVACSGSEYRLDQCQHSGWYNHNCNFNEAAGVECSHPLYPTTSLYWTTGSVRLRDGSLKNEGRVEIYLQSDWYIVCDDSWDITDASVVCRQLGYGKASEVVLESGFGDGEGGILLDDVRCIGYERTLLECGSNGPFIHDCGRNETAGVVCSTEPTKIPQNNVRLAGDSSLSSGRVEIYNNGLWGTVCGDYWGYEEASVICRQLGFAEAESVYFSAYFGPGSGPILQYLDCTGNENQWMNCFYSDWGLGFCTHEEDAGVTCRTGDANDDVRLVGAASEYEGTVEIYHEGTWGTICDDGWDNENAKVVCNQLGFPGAEMAVDNAYFGQGSGPILLDDVSCNGDEHFLVDCRRNDWYDHDCGHIEDAGVRCNIPSVHYPRLVNGDMWYEGRVEIWNGIQWTKLCSNEVFSNDEANVVCKELGFDGVDSVISGNRFGEGNAPPSDVYYSCTSYEDSLSQCDHSSRSAYYCTSSALRCNYNASLSVGAIVGIAIGSIMFIITCAVCYVAINKAQKNKRQSSNNFATISGSTNQAGPAANFAAQQDVQSTNGNVQAPPSYNDVVNNPSYYPHFTLNTHTAGGHVTVINADSPPYPVQSNPSYPNIQPPNITYPPPSNTNVAYPGHDRLPPAQNPSNFQLHPPVGASEIPIQNGESNSIEDNDIYNTIDNTQLPSS